MNQGRTGSNGGAAPSASHPGPTLASPVFTAPAENEGSGPEERSPGQQVSPRWYGAPLALIHRWVGTGRLGGSLFPHLTSVPRDRQCQDERHKRQGDPSHRRSTAYCTRYCSPRPGSSRVKQAEDSSPLWALQGWMSRAGRRVFSLSLCPISQPPE